MDIKTVRSKVNEIMKHHVEGDSTFEVSDLFFWNVEENRTRILQTLAYEGFRFDYNEGSLTIIELDEPEFARNYELKNEAFRRYYEERKEPIKNTKMDALIAQLPGFKQFETWLPYRTMSSDTVIFMFPKDNPSKSWSGMELCDVVVYDRSFEKYFIVKGKGNGFDEILINGVACRTALSDGGYFVRLRENAILHTVEDTKLYLIKEDVDVKPRFSDDELSEALRLCYGLQFK